MGKEFHVGEWTIRPDLNQASKGQKVVQIEPKVMDVLVYLATHPDEVLPREQILRAVWPGTYVSDEVLSYAISELRKALEDDAKNPSIIQTVPRRGYRLIAPVTAEEQKPGGKQVDSESPPAVQDALSATPGKRSWPLGLAAIAAVALVGLIAFWGRKIIWPSNPPAEGRTVLVVLPFENLSGDPEQEYFSDGLTEELISQLGGLEPGRLRVIARTSAMKYKGTTKGAYQIGNELGASYILEGSVRREQERVRITAQLIQVKDQTHIWAESYDRELSSILSVQNDVARACADRILITLSDRQKSRLASPRPVIPAAHEAYLRGRFFWNKRTPQNLRKAIEYFQEVIQRDSGYAPAYAGLADAHVLLVEYADAAPEKAYEEAKSAALKALAIDGGLAEAHTSLGMIKYCYEWDWGGAERDFQHAITLNPSYVTAHHWYANLLSSIGRFDEAREEIERAVQLDTLSPVTRTALAWRALAAARQYDKARQEVRAALELDAHYDIAHRRLGILYLLTGKHEEAIAEIQKGVPPLEASPLALADLGHAFAVAGRKPEAQKLLDQLQKLSAQQHVDASRFALIHAGLGEKGAAMDWLEEGYKQRDTGLVVIISDPRFEILRDQPRFQALLRAMRLPG